MRDDATMVLGIGAPRAGTTWLARYLEGHPQFYMSPLKEMHYFDAKYLPETCSFFDNVYARILPALDAGADTVDHVRMRVAMIDDPSLYLRYFERYVRDERCFGEISPAYCLLRSPMIQDIMALHPRVKFLYILRNPIDRYVSNAVYMTDGLDPDFRSPDAYVVSTLRSRHLMVRADYRRTMEHYDQAAPGNVLYLFYERLFCDATLRRICAFCGIDFLSGPYATRVNASRTGGAAGLAEATRRQAYARLAPQYAFVHDYFGGDIPENWLEDMERYQDAPAPGPAEAGV